MIIPLQSAFIQLLVERLIFHQTPFRNDALIRRQRHAMMQKIFFQRARIQGQIPHPIFTRYYADFSIMKQIWFAKMNQKFMSGMDRLAYMNVVPTQIKNLRNIFESLFKKRNTFGMVMKTKNNLSISMKFDTLPLKPYHLNLKIKLFNLTNCSCVELRNLSVNLMSEVQKFGVELEDLNFQKKIGFFYTQNVSMPGLFFWLEKKCQAESVHFYTKDSKMKEPVIYKLNFPFTNPIKRRIDDACKIKKLRLAQNA